MVWLVHCFWTLGKAAAASRVFMWLFDTSSVVVNIPVIISVFSCCRLVHKINFAAKPRLSVYSFHELEVYIGIERIRIKVWS